MARQIVGFGPGQYACVQNYASFSQATGYALVYFPRDVRNMTMTYSGFCRPGTFTTPTEIPTTDYEVITTFRRMNAGLTDDTGEVYVVTAGANGRKWSLVKGGTLVETNPIGWLPKGYYLTRHFTSRLKSDATTIDGETGQIPVTTSYFPRYSYLGGSDLTLGLGGCCFDNSATLDPGSWNKTGNVARVYTQAQTSGFVPSVFHGEFADTQNEIGSIVAWGDSISQGTGDNIFPSQRLSGLGHIHRAVNYRAPFLNCSTGGNDVQYYLDTYAYNWVQRALMADKNDIDYIYLGTNGLINGATAAQEFAWMLEFIGIRRRTGVRQINISTTLPRMNSTDGFLTESGQTSINSTFTSESQLYNTALRTQSGADHVFDMAKEIAPNGVWRPAIVDRTTYATGSPSTTSIPVALPMVTNEWRGYQAIIGTQARTITSNTTTTLTVDAFSGAPVANDTVRIGRTYTVDGVHPSPWGHYVMSQVLNARWDRFEVQY